MQGDNIILTKNANKIEISKLTIAIMFDILAHMINNEIFINHLKELFPIAKCELEFTNNFELLVAVILSAQCTDKRVNMVTKELFKELKTPEDFVKISQNELEQKIYSCGFYKNKAKNLKSCAKSLVENFGGNVPESYDQLLSLSGVGRKTANVVSATAFNKNCIAVDTHVLRVSNRLGFTKSKNPNICEKDLNKRFTQNLKDLHHRMVLFGRYYCKAQNPKCKECGLNKDCKFYSRKTLNNDGR